MVQILRLLFHTQTKMESVKILLFLLRKEPSLERVQIFRASKYCPLSRNNNICIPSRQHYSYR